MAGLSVNGVSGDGYAQGKNVQAKETKVNNELMFVEYQKQNSSASKVVADMHTPADGTKAEPLSKADQVMLESNKEYLGTLDILRAEGANQNDKAQYELDLLKSMKHLSPETKAYLEKDSQFQAAEQSIQDAISQRNTHKATISDLKQKCVETEKEYKALVKAGDFEAAQQAQDRYYNAQNDYHSAIIILEVMDGAIDKASQNAFAYATTIERWEDGDIVKYTREAVGYPEIDNIYNKEFKMVTLSNGQKAYESEGKYYQLADDGLPNPYKEIE